jgi:predicted amidohydrolase
MSKFMGLGFSLEQVVAMATNNPGAVINRAPKLGSLKVGAPGDVAVLESSRGRCRSSTRATTSAMARSISNQCRRSPLAWHSEMRALTDLLAA